MRPFKTALDRTKYATVILTPTLWQSRAKAATHVGGTGRANRNPILTPQHCRHGELPLCRCASSLSSTTIGSTRSPGHGFKAM